MSHHNHTMAREAASRRKMLNVRLADALHELGHARERSVRMCSNITTVYSCPQCGHTHTSGALYCQHRLCPICQPRRARKLALEATTVVGYLRASGALTGVGMHLLTLTQRNVEDGKLDTEIDRMLKSLGQLLDKRAWRRDIVGAARNIEITRNYAQSTWHPHIHMIVMIREGSPLTGADYWRTNWQSTMELDYTPIIDVRPVEDDGAIYEVSKYVAKSISLLERLTRGERARVLGELIGATHNRNLVAYTGIWRKARKACKIPAETDDAQQQDDSTDDCGVCGTALEHTVMQWAGTQYMPALVDRTTSTVKGATGPAKRRASALDGAAT